MRPLFKFAAPKGPGYGIAQDFHLSVLAAKAQLPTILQIVNPKGEAGAVAGFGAPMAAGALKEDLAKPLQRGMWVVASPDKKTLIQMVVISKEEAGFDPDAIAKSRMAEELPEELLARIRATWNILQFTFKSHDAAVAPALEFVSGLARRAAELTDGAVADPLSERYLLPAQVRSSRTQDGKPVASEHVAVKSKPRESGLQLYSLGMRKFALPEIEVMAVSPGLLEVGQTFMLGVCQGALSGRLLRAGDKVGARAISFQVAEGGLDRGMWEGIPVFELIPPTGKSPDEALRAWAAEQG